MPTELNWMDLRVATVGPSTNITSQISAPSLWHSIDPTTATHGPVDGMANAPTIVCPPRPKIRAPAPPLVAPPANLMIRSKNGNPRPKWMQRPSAPQTALPLVITDAAPLEAPSVPLYHCTSGICDNSISTVGSSTANTSQISVRSLGHIIELPSPAHNSASGMLHAATIIGIPTTSLRRPLIRIPFAAHNPTPVRRTYASIPEQWLEIWEHCWKVCSEIIHEPGCSRSDYDYAMMVFQQLAEHEWDRPFRVRKSYPVTVEEPWLARWRSRSSRRSRSPSSPKDPSSHRASSSRSRSPSHATSHRASSPSHSCSRSRSPSILIL
jgi:hypothetical protein